jgi:hypothetical protein
MRLLFVQYGGDYREAVERFAAGGGETYYAQKYSVDAVAEIGKPLTIRFCKTEFGQLEGDLPKKFKPIN